MAHSTETRIVGRFDLDLGSFRLRADLDVPAAGVTAVFGPSGCGKTTLLRCMSGLERAPGGTMRIGSEVWQDESTGRFVPVHRRPVGLVFQEPRLFPHLDVRGNLAFGLKRTPPQERRIEFDHVVEALGLEPLLARRPEGLSGGERQRVAIGRALLASPRLLLLDEPLASLDAPRKREILPFVRRLHTEFNLPIVYVTHAVGEILQLASTVVLMRAGTIQGVGPLATAFAAPHARDPLGATGIGTVLDTKVIEHELEYGLTRVDFGGHALEVPHRELAPGDLLRVHILPRDVTLQLGPSDARSSALNVLPGTVAEVHTDPTDSWSAAVVVDVGCPLIAQVTRKSVATLGLRPGVRVWAHVKAAALSDELLE
jgi:molybdate transport system ATP-binding protein